ncbi:hypothetical protein HMI55_003252 [Coelomomyces lativittatus]|nr:hypothetical protein HMI55_003252 [Coelomomyces lativittatus]
MLTAMKISSKISNSVPPVLSKKTEDSSLKEDCDQLSSGKVIGKKWRLVKKLGQGSFGM